MFCFPNIRQLNKGCSVGDYDETVDKNQFSITLYNQACFAKYNISKQRIEGDEYCYVLIVLANLYFKTWVSEM
jgi:hypothetical protein